MARAAQRELPTPLDEMLAETVRVLKDAATQTKNQNVIAALDWVERIQGATRVSAHPWTCACGLLVAPTVLEPYTAKDGSVHARSGCHVASVTARGSQRGEPTIGNAPSVDTHSSGETMTTYRRVDGEPIDGDLVTWGHDLEWFDGSDEPVEVIEQVWVQMVPCNHCRGTGGGPEPHLACRLCDGKGVAPAVSASVDDRGSR